MSRDVAAANIQTLESDLRLKILDVSNFFPSIPHAEFDEVVEGRGDGVVAISRGRLQGVTDTVVLPYRHLFITARDDSAASHEVAQFVLSRLK